MRDGRVRGWSEAALWLGLASFLGGLFVWTDWPWLLSGCVVLACIGYVRQVLAGQEA